MARTGRSRKRRLVHVRLLRPAAMLFVVAAAAGMATVTRHAFLPSPQASLRLHQPQVPGPAELLPAVGALALGLSLANAAAAQPGVMDMTPETFRPVCPTSDGFYGFGKGAADSLLGAEGAEYRPLAIEALLRVRLEICVLESFVYEAVIPFVQRKGVGWILPFHESIDTVIAGTVFAIALNFILFGTTKILSVLGIYHDFLLGAPLRLVGYAILPERKKREPAPFIQINWPGTTTPQDLEEEEEKAAADDPKEAPPLPLAVFGGVCKGYGIFAEVVKNVLEGVDTFVGRYLAFFSIAYIAFKWAHFRLFNDFPPL